MGDDTLWLILIGRCGTETARLSLGNWAARDALPLRRVVEEGLGRNAAAVIVARRAADEGCMPCTIEQRAIETAQRTLHPLGLRLHDYILWHGDACVSLRLTGQL